MRQRPWFARRFSDPFGDGDREAITGAAEGADLAGVRSVLFVSPRGIGRSRAAAAYLRALTLGSHRIAAAAADPDPASAPPPAQNEAFIATSLDRVEFDPLTPPDRVTAGMVDRAGLVVRIGGTRLVHVPTFVPVRDWDVPDLVGAGVSAAFEVCADLRSHVERLAVELGLPNRSLALRDRVIPGQRHVLGAGRAAAAYPHGSDAGPDADWVFAHAEARLLVEIADAPELAAEVNGRGPQRPDFTVPWLISAGAAASALARELDWRAVGPSPRIRTAEEAVDRVVDWLVALGALRPFSDAQRLELRRSGAAQRAIDDPPDQWPRGLAGEYPATAAVRAAEEDLATWEVVPGRMLAVYPDLDLVDPYRTWTDDLAG